MVPPPDAPVPLRDAEIAQEIARAAARGRDADRRPTLEQLLAAFGESDPTPEARRRVAAALDLAGVRTAPPVAEAAPGARVTLGGERPARTTIARRALAGVGALGLLLGGAALAAGVGSSGGGDRLSALPAGTTAATTATRAATPDETTATTATTGTTAPSPPATTTEKDAEAEKPASKKQTSEKAKKKPKKKPTRVTVRLRPAAPTFLCADDGNGKVLFHGTLSEPEVFKGKRVRLNVGLASTQVLVNGKTVALEGSPAGLDITRKAQTPLPLGRRPAC